jgi:hypothetical protein
MEAKDIIRLPDPRKDVRLELREVLLDLHEKPHLLRRARLTGWGFQHRAQEPFMLVGDVVSRFVRITPDGLTADAYFDKPLPHADTISFGYGNIVAWDFDLEVDERRLERLERSRLPADVVDAFSDLRE